MAVTRQQEWGQTCIVRGSILPPIARRDRLNEALGIATERARVIHISPLSSGFRVACFENALFVGKILET